MSAGLSKGEQQFMSGFDLSPIATALLDGGGLLFQANRALCELLGCGQAELQGAPLSRLCHPDDAEAAASQLAAGLAGNSPLEPADHRFLHRDGHTFWIRLSCAPVPAGAHDPARLIVHLQPQTAHRADQVPQSADPLGTALTLATATAQLRLQTALLDQARDAMVLHRMDRTIMYWNQGAQRLFGFTPEQALGTTFEALMGPAATLSASAHQQLLKQGRWTGELECVAADGRMLVVERSCTVMRASGDGPAVVMAVNTDVTERRRAEKEIVLLNNLMEQRIRKRTAELEESNEDLRDFAYSVAHDLRGPLGSIDGFSAQLEIALAAQMDDKSRHYLKRVRAGVRLMADLTDGLLALADLSNAPLLRQSVDLSSVAQRVVERLREQSPEREVEVLINGTPRAQGDVRMLTGMLEQLLDNAWKFSSRQPRARISFGGEIWPDGSYLYHVKDNGVGFDPAYAYKLFGPFQRLHTPQEFDGTGIGLAIVRKIAALHGGRVWAESELGEGASFYFTLNDGAAVAVASGESSSDPLATQGPVASLR